MRIFKGGDELMYGTGDVFMGGINLGERGHGGKIGRFPLVSPGACRGTRFQSSGSVPGLPRHITLLNHVGRRSRGCQVICVSP